MYAIRSYYGGGLAVNARRDTLLAMAVVMARDWEIPCNWKVLTENFMESYHHAGAHAKTLQSYNFV